MKIISHSADMDGKLSAFLVAKKFDITNENDFIMTDYGKHDEWLSKINKDEEVVICDFSFENKDNDMKKLYEITNKVIWIDHHESSINDYGDYGNNIPGIRVIGTAACMLTYIYFYILEKNIDWNNLKVYNLTQKECELLYDKAPLLVRLVHDYDVWRFQYGEDTEKFKLGLDSENIESPLDLRLKDLFYSENDIKNAKTLKDLGIDLDLYWDENFKHGKIVFNESIIADDDIKAFIDAPSPIVVYEKLS